MSGAAISPSSGKTGSRALTFLMTLANMRLGVWVPNPRWVAGAVDAEKRRYRRPRPWYLLQELLGTASTRAISTSRTAATTRTSASSSCCAAAARRSTASTPAAARGSRRSATRSRSRARELGVEIHIDPARVVSSGVPLRAQENVLRTRFTYAGGEEGVLIYARNFVCDASLWDVKAHQLKDPRFPNDSTMDQLYTEQKFESYRVLGERAAAERSS